MYGYSDIFSEVVIMLYIFNLDEQLQAVLKNEGTACPYYDAVHTEKLNMENTFSFTVPADHPDSQYVTEGNLAAFQDLDMAWQLFEIKRIDDAHGDGLTRTAFCEHAFYELIDDFIQDVRPTGCSANFALTQALSGTRWSVGTVNDLGTNSTNYYYESALSAVQKVASVWAGELQFRVVVNGGVISARYVDLLSRVGADTGKQFAYGRHTKSIKREVDLTTVATAMFGRGKGVEVDTGGYGRRLDFGAIEWTVAGGNPVDKPLNQEWVGDPDALTAWGRPGGRHRFGIFQDDQETDAATLLQKTWGYLQQYKTPRVTYSLDVADLERLSGYSHEKVRKGDTVRVIDRIFSPALLVAARVVEIDRDLLQPDNTKIVLGNFAPDLAADALVQQQVNQVTRDRQGVWDRATQFNTDGTLNTSWLNGIINILSNQLQSTTSNWYTDTNGNIVFETIDGTAAMMLTGNGFMLSNEKDLVTGDWIWRTFGTGDGFTADELNAGQIRTSLIKIFGNTEFYWDGDNLYIINPDNLNEQIRLSKEGIRFTRDGGTTWNVAIGFSGIKMIGKSDDGSTEYAADGVRSYDSTGELKAHFGHYETLAAQTAAFTRASIAYDDYGNLIASGVPRYEYMRQPAPVWQDLFDTDQLSSQYTSFANTAWSINNGSLTATGNSQNSGLIKNDILIQDCEIEINCDQANHGGIIARHQDSNNYYFLLVQDDSGIRPGSNLELWKVVNGVQTNIIGYPTAVADMTWPRGTSADIKFSLHGSRLEAYFNNTKVISVIDTTFAGGGVGLWCYTGTQHYLDFAVYYANQGVEIEEGATNLLTANQSNVETDTAGFYAGASGTTLTRDTTMFWQGAASLKAVCDGTVIDQGAYVVTPVNAVPGAAYAGGVWLKGSGTVGVRFQDSGSGVIYPDKVVTLNSAWQFVAPDPFTYGAIAGTILLVIHTISVQAITFWADGWEIGQKAYTTSWITGGEARAAEALSIPTVGVFAKGNWAVELEFTPTGVMNAGDNYKELWTNRITDGVNAYYLAVSPTGALTVNIYSNSTLYAITSAAGFISQGNTYIIMLSGNGSVMNLYCNGIQVGLDTAYAEPIGSLPAAMGIGCYVSGVLQANGTISNFRISSRARTLTEHQTAYNTGLPLTVDDATTYLMTCDGTLQPTVRKFGLWLASGEIGIGTTIAGNAAGDLETQTGAQGKADTAQGNAEGYADGAVSDHNNLSSPHNLPSYCTMTSDGIKVFDNLGALRVWLGQYLAGKYGLKVVDGEIYSTTIRTGAETDTSYIELAPPNALRVIYNNQKAIEMVSGGAVGNISIYDSGTEYTRLIGGYSLNSVMHAALISLNSRPLALVGPNSNNISLKANNGIDYTAGSSFHRFFGDLYMGSGSKYNMEETENYGKRGLAVRESPEQKYIDEGKAQLENGLCTIVIDPIFLECIEPDTNDTPWLIHLTSYTDTDVYVAEIGPDYFIAKERNGGISNSVFVWSLSATRKEHAFDRLPEVMI